MEPEDGEQVLVLSPSGDLAQGMVLPALYRNDYPAPVSDPDKRVSVFADGAWFEYDRKAKHLKGVLPDGATTELVSSGGIELTGDLLVKGNITSTQDITEKIRSMAVDRGIYNGHSHPGVLAGPDRTPVGSRSRLNGLPFSFLEKICTMRRV